MINSTRFRYVTGLITIALLGGLATPARSAESAASNPAAPAGKPDAAPAAAGAITMTAAAPTSQAGGLRVIDAKVGSGKEAQPGKAAIVQYTGWLYDEHAPENKGKEFDSTATRGGLPFGFIVGVGRVIRGWDQGIVGMKVGGKRTLVVPPTLGYGDKEVGAGLIPPNSTLVFDIELVDVKP